jgi:DNA-binding IclR family transcriptional regulator
METGGRLVRSVREIDRRYYVEAAARTLELLQAVAKIDGPASLSAIVAELGWSKPTVYRLVRTLETLGALRQENGGGYLLGPALITLGRAALRSTRLLEVARPYLESLYGVLGETTVLTMLDGDDVVYLDRIDADKILVPYAHLGSRLPAYCTSTGHVLLAGLPDDEVRQRLAQREFVQLAPNTLRSISEVLERLAEVRRQGFAINDEELALGHRSVAAPVTDHSGEVAAALSVSVPAVRVSRSDLIRFANEALVPAAGALSAALGATPAGRGLAASL